ncbi:MAG TPA: FMN-binding protein [Kofleriaceae bacterium]|nr:FMN-binding protein [Kofleriaceae bacterium]
MKWIVLACLLVATPALADRVLLKEADAPALLGGKTATRKTLELTADQLAQLGKDLGRKITASSYPYLEVRDDHGHPLGAIFLLDVIGQAEPITFAVAVGADGALRDVAVMVYRESHGEEIADKRFRKQFAGKRAADPIALGKDIDAISGATISSRSATFAARKALRLAELVRYAP